MNSALLVHFRQCLGAQVPKLAVRDVRPLDAPFPVCARDEAVNV